MSKNRSKKRKQPKEPINQNQLPRHVEVPFLDRDDLTLIDGILPQTELALNSIGIRKYSDFTAYTSESLTKLLQQRTGIDISFEAIENKKWIESALALAEKNHPEKNGEQETNRVQAEKSDFQDEKSGAFSSEEETGIQSVPEKEVEDVSSKEKSLEKISNNGDGRLLASGKLDNLKQKMVKDFEENIALKMIDVKYNQIELPMMAKAPAKKVMHGEISCNLTGKNAILETQYRFPLCIQIHAVDVATEQSELMASKCFQLTPQQDTYRIHLEFEIPKAGYYRLNAVAFLLAPEPTIDFKPGPFLRVIPEQNYNK